MSASGLRWGDVAGVAVCMCVVPCSERLAESNAGRPKDQINRAHRADDVRRADEPVGTRTGVTLRMSVVTRIEAPFVD